MVANQYLVAPVVLLCTTVIEDQGSNPTGAALKFYLKRIIRLRSQESNPELNIYEVSMPAT